MSEEQLHIDIAARIIVEYTEILDRTEMNRDERTGYMVVVIRESRRWPAHLGIPATLTAVRAAFDEIDKSVLDAGRDLVLKIVRSVFPGGEISAENEFSHDGEWQLIVNIPVGNTDPHAVVQLMGECHRKMNEAGAIRAILHPTC